MGSLVPHQDSCFWKGGDWNLGRFNSLLFLHEVLREHVVFVGSVYESLPDVHEHRRERFAHLPTKSEF